MLPLLNLDLINVPVGITTGLFVASNISKAYLDNNLLIPLLSSLLMDSVTCIPSILDGFIDCNLQDKNGVTILMYACFNNLPEVALKLIETGKCDINIQTNDGHTALELYVIIV